MNNPNVRMFDPKTSSPARTTADKLREREQAGIYEAGMQFGTSLHEQLLGLSHDS